MCRGLMCEGECNCGILWHVLYACTYSPTSIIRPPWPTPKSKHSDKQRVRIIESIFDVRLTTPTPISYRIHLTSWIFRCFIPFLAEKNSSLVLYMTYLNIIWVLLTVIHTNIANDGCTALYCACAHQCMPCICTLTCTFAWLRSSDNQGFG